MKVMFESRGDFNNLEAWLKKVSNANAANALGQIGMEGAKALADKTPKDSGETASGWRAEVTGKGDQAEVNWTNVAHPEASVNVAIIIDQGHGTGTGGFVPPVPYIKNAMESVWKTAGDKIAKELVK